MVSNLNPTLLSCWALCLSHYLKNRSSDTTTVGLKSRDDTQIHLTEESKRCGWAFAIVLTDCHHLVLK
ncbi:hypothetical protein Pcinc_025802 [Petrolisthes cinctipes]|uniref:Uncharacterized protein n=1 Tax=Petrolisthes cinctipes TaxID=88211 RepID=A0AAE1KAX7_PETCI|nr:hypothetical protein Pcinc_025802 [Petrolisthes cinctipes]